MNILSSQTTMQAKQKLFIYIPTYSRPKCLQNQLDSLVPQVKAFPDRVRLIVRDNDSPGFDLSTFEEQYIAANITFSRNIGNIGANANISLGFIFSNLDEFLWILSDNDLVQFGCVEYLLGKLDSSCDFIVLNNFNLHPKTIPWIWESNLLLPITLGQGLISATLFNTNSIRNSIENAYFFHNSSFPHLAVAIATAKEKGKVFYLQLPIGKVLKLELDSSESSGNYSLSYVGMPLLLSLFSLSAARAFARDWAEHRAYLLFQHAYAYPELAISSEFNILKYGGFIVHLYMLKGRCLALGLLIYSSLRRNFKCIADNNLFKFIKPTRFL